MAGPELLLVFSLLAGIGLFVVYGAQIFKVRFTLGAIFLTITVACVGLALVVALGPAAFAIGRWLLLICLPPLNFVCVALLCVAVVHVRGARQAVAIGRLIPLTALATADAIRIGIGLATMRFEVAAEVYVFIFVVAYATSFTAGYACCQLIGRVKPTNSAVPAHHIHRSPSWAESDQS